MMICAFCGSSQTKILDSREKDNTVRRRRICMTCGKRYSTVEILETTYKRMQYKLDEPIRKQALMNAK